MMERYTAPEMRDDLAVDLTHMALCSPAPVKETLVVRFADGAAACPPR